jgi:hypothetical protein
MHKRDLVALVKSAGLTVEGPETIDELAEAIGHLVISGRAIGRRG